MYSIKGIEKTPGPAFYMAPSDFGHMLEVTVDEDDVVDQTRGRSNLAQSKIKARKAQIMALSKIAKLSKGSRPS